METHLFKLVTFICEPVLAYKIVEVTRSMGASGFTMVDVKGEGTGEKSSGEFPEEKVKIEVIVSKDLANQIMDRIAKDYFPDYSIILYSTDIAVIRSKKFETAAQKKGKS